MLMKSVWAENRPKILVQVRVYRSPDKLIDNALVRLSNGLTGATGSQKNPKGCVNFEQQPRGRYTATAVVNGLTYQTSRIVQMNDNFVRIDIKIP